jgi:IS1 family transposase
MNKLPIETRVQILSMLVEGSSMRSISRVCNVSINTVSKLLVDAGNACAAFHDKAVREVASKNIQCDEIWSFCYAKQKNAPDAKAAPEIAGNVWTWTALDADSKLIVSWLVGSRDSWAAYQFLSDLRTRLANRVQLTTDGHNAYLEAMRQSFGDDVDYAMLVKIFAASPESAKGRYSPAECIGARKEAITGNPDPEKVSTSFAERQNLTMRMSMRRFTRLTNAFSKKYENHCHALALYFVWYNWIRIHKTLRVTPAMAAGLTDQLLDMSAVVEMIDAAQPEQEAKIRGWQKRLQEPK